MNIAQIKEKYTILDYLKDDQIIRKTPAGYLCKAPWREDTHPSLTVTSNGKGWKDHATGEHGNLIDLVCKDLGTTDLSRVCAAFEDLQPSSSSFDTPKDLDKAKEKESSFASFSTHPLQSRGLFAYLHERGINIEIAKQLLSEAHYSFTNQSDSYLYALAYPNDKGGYELRSSRFKGSASPKGITTHLIDENAPYVVFEGFMDMLSFATLDGGVKRNYLTLNSVIFADQAIEVLKGVSSKIFLCLDNDPAGEETTNKILTAIPGSSDIRSRIRPYKDVNDYLRARGLL